MIEIKKDTNNQTIDGLSESTMHHVNDVHNGLEFIADKLHEAGNMHDFTKFLFINEFHEALTSKEITNSEWYKLHINRERHHLSKRVPDDVNLIDVLEYMVDCMSAGLARSGNIYEITLPDEVLQRSFKNTIELLQKNMELVD